MSERSDRSAPHTNHRLEPLRCGDCRLPLPPEPHGPPRPPGPAQPMGPEPGTYYCPGCAKPVNEPLACPHCGSLICPGCGTPLESADDLGIG